MTGFWSAHTHSRYSANDAMAYPVALVERAYDLGYPALGLVDHGTVSGVVQLYKTCRKKGMEPLPGTELYITPDHAMKKQANQHLTVLAYSEIGYRNLVVLSNLAARNFFYKPRVDYADLAALAADGKTDGLAVFTGCYSGGVTQALVGKGRNGGRQSAEQIIRALQGWFPRVYVELMNHGINWGGGVSDRHIVNALVDIADGMGVPYVVTTDCHYLEKQEQTVHNALKQLIGYSDDPSEAAFKGAGYWLQSEDEVAQKFDPVVFQRSVDNLVDLANRAKVRIPELEEFSLKVPDVSKTGEPMDELRRHAQDGLVEKGLERLQKRLDDELDVIDAAGMAGYMLLVRLLCEEMTRRGIWFYARGSAAGSLVVHVLKISYKEPTRWSLRMDRFMGKDRTRPPDIDLDVEHTRRDEMVEWMEGLFSVRQVGSHMQMSMSGEDDDDGKGSLLVKYYSTMRKIQGKERAPKTWDQVPDDDRKMLMQLSGRGLISGPGTHAAGFIVAPDEASVAEIPLAWMANRNAFVTAYGKKDIEALGFTKLDLLGSRTLTAIRINCEALGMTREQWEALPENDAPTFKRFSSGRVAGSFQAEGGAQRRGFKDLKPRTLADIVAGQALYRPAMLGPGGGAALYLERRQGKKPVPDQHDDIALVTKDTYGIALYQEQVIELMRAIGMGPEELTDMLDAVKASNAASKDAAIYLQQAKGRVHELATARGWTDQDVDWLVDGLAGYAEYSFNKSHSLIYGDVAYRTVYMAEHHPVEFWLGVLIAHSIPKHKKEAQYIREARAEKVRILPAHVNRSQISYTLDQTWDRQGKVLAICRGLTALKGVGEMAATELVRHAPYTSLTDLGERVTPRKVTGAKWLALGKTPADAGGVIAVLDEYGALDDLPVSDPQKESL